MLFYALGLRLKILEIFLQLCCDLFFGREAPRWMPMAAAATPGMMPHALRGVVGRMSAAAFT